MREFQSEQGGRNSDQKRTEEILERTWMALPRHGWGRKYRTADNAPCTVERQDRHHEWVAYRTDVSERSLRRRSQIYGCIRLIESGLRQVHRWYSGSTKDS